MTMATADATSYVQLLLYLGAVITLVIALLVISRFLGERGGSRGRRVPFESGIIPVGYGRLRFSAQFYVVAMLFVLFDLEAIFLFTWAISFRAVGWGGYAAMLVFLFILTAALAYEWRMGALDWGKKQRRPRFSVEGD